MPGKPFKQSVEVKVTEEDEPDVRAWLAERGQTMRAMWERFLG